MKICELEKDLPVYKFITISKKPFNYYVYRAEGDIKELTEMAEQLKKLKSNYENVIQNFNTISDFEFFKNVFPLYHINQQELMKKYYENMFLKPTEFNLKTEDVSSFQVSEGHGRDFSYWQQWYKCGYVVIAEANEDFDTEKIYTKKEILNLVNQNKILVTNKTFFYGKELTDTEALKIKKDLKDVEIPTLKLNYNFNSIPSYLDDEDYKEMYKENKPAFKAIKKDFTVKGLIKDYKVFLENYNKTMQNIATSVKESLSESKIELDERQEKFNEESKMANDTLNFIYHDGGLDFE